MTTIRPVFSGTQRRCATSRAATVATSPGDTLEYTIATRNSGNDTGKNVVVTDVLPAGLSFVAGSLEITAGANLGVKRIWRATIRGEYVVGTRAVTVRLGSGIKHHQGGTLAADETATFRFRVTIDANAQGNDRQPGLAVVAGRHRRDQGITTPTTWQSSSSGNVPGGTPVVISTCSTNADCGPDAPICDTSATPRRCVCQTSSDCGPGRICNPSSKTCVECMVGQTGQCSPTGSGELCLLGGVCGCNSDSDCGGRRCDTLLHLCQAQAAPICRWCCRGLPPAASFPGQPADLLAQRQQSFWAAHPGRRARHRPVAHSQNDLTWTCTAQGGATCPAAMGSGPIATRVDLPAGGKLLYTLRMSVGDSDQPQPGLRGQHPPPVGYADQNPNDNFVSDSVLVSMPPLGPGSIGEGSRRAVRHDNSVTHVIDVENRGDQPAPGATLVYDVPAGTTIADRRRPRLGCGLSASGSQVVCTRTEPIPPGPASSVRITVTAPNPGMDLPLRR